MAAHNRIRIEGLAEFKATLRKLPADLAREGRTIVDDAARQAYTDIYNAYPVVTGNLRKGLRRFHESSPFGGRAVVENKAKHANLFEVGSASRKTPWGTPNPFKAGNIFIPRAIKWRRVMTEGLVDLVERHGFTVSGV